MRQAKLADLASDRSWPFALLDPPAHTLRRKLAFRPFRPGALRELEPTVTKLTDELIDRFAERGEVEFVAEFADLLPVHVIMTMLGFRGRTPIEQWAGDATTGLARPPI